MHSVSCHCQMWHLNKRIPGRMNPLPIKDPYKMPESSKQITLSVVTRVVAVGHGPLILLVSLPLLQLNVDLVRCPLMGSALLERNPLSANSKLLQAAGWSHSWLSFSRVINCSYLPLHWPENEIFCHLASFWLLDATTIAHLCILIVIT